MDMELPPHNHGNLYCNDFYKQWCPPDSAIDNWVPFPYWDASAQVHFFRNQLQPSNFLCNEIGFDEFVPPGTLITGSKRLEYITIFRDPVDRFMSFFMYTTPQHGFPIQTWIRDYFQGNATIFEGDLNFLVQMLAGPSACGQPPASHVLPAFSKGLLCGREALEIAKRRLDSLYVVLVLDWLHLSGPLLCQRLGWCYAAELEELASPASNCGAHETLAAAGTPEWMEAALRERMALDSELLLHARALARQHLHAAGVELPKRAGAEELGLPPRTVCKPAGDKAHVRGKSCPVRPR